MEKYLHICEVCGVEEILSSEAGFKAGWDYPPRMGAFGLLSPRTCPTCPMIATLWWRVQSGEVQTQGLTEADEALIKRINTEPASIIVTN